MDGVYPDTLTSTYGMHAITATQYTYFTTGNQVVASLDFVLQVYSLPAGMNGSYRVLEIIGVMPGGPFNCGSLAPGLNWNANQGALLGPVTVHSASFKESNVPAGQYPARNSEGGYVIANDCTNNRFMIAVKLTQDIIVGPLYYVSVEMHYPTS